MSSKVDVYEKLGAFYLGRAYDPESGETAQAPLLYDSKDLVTHAVCVGMTGSGKTGLCVGLLEEAAIDGIPAIVIDVKGDLGNLLLTFPELAGKDFRPWVDESQAQREGLSSDEFAGEVAELWKNGLAKWDQDGDRIRRLKDAAEFAIYTPGSESGLPVSILSSFNAPPEAVLDDSDAFQDRVATATSSLLALLGIDADPIRSREAILLSNILDHAWRAGEDLDMASLIHRIQDPPIERVGVMPIESFYPGKDRFELAMSLNNLLASPSFQAWMKGEPLDVDRLLYTPSGKPRVAIFSIAHLADAERMFFVSLLLNQTLSWMRGRSGTSSLRAILYMDEIFGYLPPIGNPPSKKPLLTMLKQARAFGLGLVLATQNPVDLDYKALSNIGTWFLGRLQTQRDKDRVMDGLTSGDSGLTKKQIEKILSGVEKRVFMLHNVHEEEPVLFRVRWVMSYLAGPLTRRQIKRLMSEAPRETEAAAPAKAPRKAAPAPAPAQSARPVLPSGVEERFLPVEDNSDDEILYRPYLVADTKVHFVDSRRGLEASEERVLLAEVGDDVGDTDWSEAEVLEGFDPDRLEEEPEDGAHFGEMPAPGGTAKSYKTWNRKLKDSLYRSRRYELLRSTAYKLIAEPGESEREFRIRLKEAMREKRDLEVAKLRKKYESKRDRMEERVRRALQKVEKERQQAKEQKLNAMLSVGTSILGAFLGRRKVTATKLSTAGRRVSRTFKEGRDVDRAEEDAEALERQLEELDLEFQNDVDELEERFDPSFEELETLALKPRKTDVDVRLLALAWAPFRVRDGVAEAAW